MTYHIYIYGVIGLDATAKTVIDQIQASKPNKGDTVIAHIHSPGGYVSEGYAIHDALQSQAQSLGFKLITQAEGECKSIATVIFLAAKIRRITSNADFMIHNPWGELQGDAKQMHKYADNLEQEEKKLSQFYSDKTGNDVAAILLLMGEETYYNSTEAVKMKFATEIVDTMKAVALFKGNQIKTNKSKQMSKFNIKAFLQDTKKALETLVAGQPLALESSLEDGTAITIETEAETPAVGDVVTFTESGESVPDASHTLADGVVIVTVDGVITEVTTVDAATEEVEALKAQVAELTLALEAVQPILQAMAKVSGKAAPVATTRVRNIQTGVSKDKPKASFTKDQIMSNKRREPIKA